MRLSAPIAGAVGFLTLVAVVLLPLDLLPANAAGVTVTTDVPFASPSGVQLALDIYAPQGAAQLLPAVLVVHGGGWSKGDKTDVSTEADDLAAAGFVAFAPNYRLAPQWTYPAQVDDVESAVSWVQQHGAAYGADGPRIGTLGLSAGGTLVEQVAYQLDGVGAVASWSGPTDLLALWDAGKMVHVIRRYLGCDACSEEQLLAASPITYSTTTSEPSYLYGSFSDFVPYPQQTELASALNGDGVAATVTIEPSGHAAGYVGPAMSPTVLFLQEELGT